jgi:hypothetical protein
MGSRFPSTFGGWISHPATQAIRSMPASLEELMEMFLRRPQLSNTLNCRLSTSARARQSPIDPEPRL